MNYNPDAIIPSFGLMVVAVVFGLAVYRFVARWRRPPSVALAVFAGLDLLGVEKPVLTYEWFAAPETRTALRELRETPRRQKDEPRFELPYGAAAAVAHLRAVGDEAAAEDLRSRGSA